MPKISVVIITYNEEANIARCIKSVYGLADEIIVVDSFSDDNTVPICNELEGVKVYLHAFESYIKQKNYALSLASNDYVLSLDGDEALSQELYDQIKSISDNFIYDGYYFNRRSNYCGQWIKHSGWYPDRKLRLFNRRKGSWGGIDPHDSFIMNRGSNTKVIKEDILHWVLNSYEDHLEKANKFSTIAAGAYHKLGRRASICTIFFHSGWRFIKAYFLRLGFLDGYNGFVICTFSAFTTFLKYMKLRQLNLYDRVRYSKKLNANNKQQKTELAKPFKV